MDLIIGLATALIVLLTYCFFEKTSFLKIKTNAVILILVIHFSAFIYKPFFHLFEWVLLSILFYVFIDDLQTRTLNILLPIVVSVFSIFLNWDLFLFITGLLVFVLFLTIAKLSKESLIGEGDAYVVLSIMWFIGDLSSLYSLYISCLLALFVFVILFIFKKGKEYSFAPFLIFAAILVKSGWHVEQIAFYGTLLFIPLSIIYYFKNVDRKEK